MNDGAKNFRFDGKAVTVPLTVTAFIAAVWALKAASIVTVPLACSLYLAVLVRPLQERIQRALPRRIRWLSLILVFLVGVGVAALLAGLIWAALALLQSKAPPYVETLKMHWRTLVAWTGERGLPLGENLDRFTGMIERLLGIVTSAVVSIWSSFALIVLILFLTTLLLLEWNEWRQKARDASLESRSTRALAAIDDISKRVRSH
ncbi:MAG TPA: AI-2E family transporter, partial [Candidatus Eisenbacteria bacterium]|nr:AI-2E family transporter [Candidatus Eisenbacteria bacterium]